MRVRGSVFSLLLLLGAGVASGAAQQPPLVPQGELPAPPIRIEVDLVNVVFSVTDRRDRHVQGLGPDDFIVTENGVQQEVKFFTNHTDLPLRIGLLVDTSNSVRSRFQFEQEAAIDFLHTILRPKTDLAFVLAFDASAVVVQDFTDDPLDLADAIRSLRVGGGTALYDAIYLACKVKMAEPTRENHRRMLIVLSDGEDSVSLVSREETLEMCRRHEVTIFTVSTAAPPITYSGESRHLQDPCKVMGGQGDKDLRRFAEGTGGFSYCPFNTIDVGRSFERIANSLRTQYTLAYTPTHRGRDIGYRKISIKTRRKGLKVHHRPGYYPRRDQAAAASSPSSN